MAEVKDKIVTVESLSALHTHNKEAYMTKQSPTGTGTLTITGNGNFSGIVNTGSLQLGDARLEYDSTDGVLKIVFLDTVTDDGTI